MLLFFRIPGAVSGHSGQAAASRAPKPGSPFGQGFDSKSDSSADGLPDKTPCCIRLLFVIRHTGAAGSMRGQCFGTSGKDERSLLVDADLIPTALQEACHRLFPCNMLIIIGILFGEKGNVACFFSEQSRRARNSWEARIKVGALGRARPSSPHRHTSAAVPMMSF